MNMKLFLVGCGLSLGVASSSFAATTGTINATLTLTTGCLVNGQPETTNVDFGDLDFGTHAATFTTLSATLIGSAGNGIFVNCTEDEAYNVRILSSKAAPTQTPFGDESSQPRYLLLDGGTVTGIAYTLYNDSGFSAVIANGEDLVANGTPDATLGENYPIYARITGGNNNPNIPVGTYTDIINVVVNY